MRNLSLIAAVGRNLELGYNNDLIWHLKEDLNFFKTKTMGSYIIMGRMTHDSLKKRLLGRKYIILSRQNLEVQKDDFLFPSIDETINFIKENIDEQFYVIGGAQIYSSFLPYVDSMYLTEIKDTFSQADTFFPKFDESDWLANRSELLEENGVQYNHVLYLRNRNINKR